MKVFKYFLLLTYLFFSEVCPSFGQVKYDAHLEAAKATGIPPIKNQSHLTSLDSKKKLVVVFPKTGYTIAKLTHSKPYVTAKSYRIL